MTNRPTPHLPPGSVCILGSRRMSSERGVCRTASGRRQTARGASNGTVLQERIRKSGGALDGTRPTRFSPVCPPRRKIVIGANSLRQDFALNLLAKRRLCNTVGGGIGRSVEDCVVSDARSRAAATTNLARSSQALVLSTLFMICPQWSAWWPADEQIVPPIPRLSYGMIETPHLIQRLPNNRDL